MTDTPEKPKVGRPRKAPKGEGYDVRARLTVEAIAALKVIMKRGLNATDAVNVALVHAAQPDANTAAQLEALIQHVLLTKKEHK